MVQHYFVILIQFHLKSRICVERCYPLKRAIGLSYAFTNHIMPRKLYTDILSPLAEEKKKKTTWTRKKYRSSINFMTFNAMNVIHCMVSLKTFNRFSSFRWRAMQNHQMKIKTILFLVSLAHFLNPLDWKLYSVSGIYLYKDSFFVLDDVYAFYEHWAPLDKNSRHKVWHEQNKINERSENNKPKKNHQHQQGPEHLTIS